jgi:hypothetical protein
VNPTSATFNLCSDLTIRGAGPKSVLRVANGVGTTYVSIFSATGAISNVVIKDFKVDQNPAGNQGNVPPERLHVINIALPSSNITGVTISGMFFDSIAGVHAIHLESTGDLKATIVNNYFNFNKASSGPYPNAAVYLDGWQQVVTGNTFLASPNGLSQGAGTAIETHGGRSTISNNTTNAYATAVAVMQTVTAVQSPPPPNEVVVANNSVTGAQNGISLAGQAGQTIQGVSISGNTIGVGNNDRMPFLGTGATVFTGIRYDGTTPGDVDGVSVSNNIVAMQPQYATNYTSGSGVANGGILLHTTGNLSNVIVNGNIVTNSPVTGIRVGTSCTTCSVQRIRVTENSIVDAGNDGNITAPSDAVYRHAIGLWGTAKEVDLMRNMVYDTTKNPTTDAVNGFYSLYLNQSTSSTNVRTSQNTVRVNSTTSGVQLLAYQLANTGLVDATNANDVQIRPNFSGGSQGIPTQLDVDFISFSRYIVTITGQSQPGSRLVINVQSPPADPNNSTYVQWTVGQIVTLRFICANLNPAGGCRVTFAPAYSVDPTNPALDFASQNGRAITFQVENLSTDPSAKRFFELYRSPADVPN